MLIAEPEPPSSADVTQDCPATTAVVEHGMLCTHRVMLWRT